MGKLKDKAAKVGNYSRVKEENTAGLFNDPVHRADYIVRDIHTEEYRVSRVSWKSWGKTGGVEGAGSERKDGWIGYGGTEGRWKDGNSIERAVWG